MQTPKNKAFPLKNSIIRLSLQMGVILAIILISFLMLKQTLFVAEYSEDMGGVSDENNFTGTRQAQVLQANQPNESLPSASPTQNIIVTPKVNPETPLNDVVTITELPTPTLTKALPTVELTETSLPPTIEPSATIAPPTNEPPDTSVSPTNVPTSTSVLMCGETLNSTSYPFILAGGYGQCIVLTNLPTVYYVAPTGNDNNPGTQSQPWKTIQKAANTMLGGDTVYIRGGTYNQRVKLFYRYNTSGPYMTFTNYPGEEVILDGTGIAIQYGEGLFDIEKSDYIRVYGIKVQHSNGAGIYVIHSNNIEIVNNRTYDTVKSGVSAWGSTNVIIEGNDIALACNSHPGYPMSEENISLDNVDGFEVKNNYVHQAANIPYGGAGGEGINLKDGSRNGTVHNNIVHLDERADGEPSNRLAFGVDAWNSTTTTGNIEFYNNVAYNNYVGFIVSSELGGAVDGVKIYNNIAYNNIKAGFAIVWWSGTKDGIKKNIQFINNTSYHNGYGFQNTSPLNQNVLIENNIFNQNTVSVQLLSGSESQFTVDHNLFYGSGGTYGTNLVIGDPRFVNPTGADFHLQIGSPAIDSGTSLNAPSSDFDGNPRPRGAGYDIGAYEY